MSSLEGERRVGWEANGGFLTGSTIAMQGGTLDALPTRDAVLPILVALHAARMSQRSLLDLFAALPRRFGRSGLLDKVPPEAGRALLEHFGPGDPSVRSVRFSGDRLQWMDPSGREHDGDGALARRLRDTRHALVSHFGPLGGLESLNEIDFLDGIRMTFAGGDIVHVRPSGNAPQLRFYAFADSEDRADQIASSMLAEPSGVLRELLSAAETGRGGC